jgi:hypothetical protein
VRARVHRPKGFRWGYCSRRSTWPGLIGGWLLVDERSGAALADHPADLDPHAAETEAFTPLKRHSVA